MIPIPVIVLALITLVLLVVLFGKRNPLIENFSIALRDGRVCLPGDPGLLTVQGYNYTSPPRILGAKVTEMSQDYRSMAYYYRVGEAASDIKIVTPEKVKPIVSYHGSDIPVNLIHVEEGRYIWG